MNWRPLAFAAVAAGALGCDALFTSAPDAGDQFDAPLDGLTSEEMAIFIEGDGQFARPFSAAEGLGPIFNNVSCAACHRISWPTKRAIARTLSSSVVRPRVSSATLSRIAWVVTNSFSMKFHHHEAMACQLSNVLTSISGTNSVRSGIAVCDEGRFRSRATQRCTTTSSLVSFDDSRPSALCSRA